MAPSTPLAFPSSQSRQLEPPAVGPYFPTAQDTHAEPSELLYFPAEQVSQELAPISPLAFPSSQFRHTSGLEAPVVGEYFPAAQDTHADASVAELDRGQVRDCNIGRHQVRVSKRRPQVCDCISQTNIISFSLSFHPIPFFLRMHTHTQTQTQTPTYISLQGTPRTRHLPQQRCIEDQCP